MTKTCTCGQKMEFEAEDVEFISCPHCAKKVSELFEGPVGTAPPPPRAKGLFVSVGEETKGPYSLKQVKAMYESGQLTMDTLCCHDGDKQWRPLVELEAEIYADEKKKAATPPPLPTYPPPQHVYHRATENQIRGESLHPIMAALLGFLCLTGLAQMMMGQGGKGLLLLIGAVILTALTGGLGLLIAHPIVAIDAVMVASALRAGRAVGPYEFFPSA